LKPRWFVYVHNSWRGLLDTAVAVIICGALVVSGTLVVLERTNRYRLSVIPRLLTSTEGCVWFWPSIGAVITAVLLAWLTLGRGLDSALWKWLPPFVLFQKQSRTVRLIVVLLMVFGTLLGSFSSFLGLSPL
jgi:Kef-type K+ transport system membrane component KefB